ncbi:MAG: NAD(+) diphosphatase [Candidatus Dormibacteraeota bacterium]|nr:NAD(+) diphosphatase [Candidatus Dormibacteraeota bacterium]
MNQNPAALALAFAGSGLLVRRDEPTELPSVSDLDACGPMLAGPFAIGRIGDRAVMALAIAPETICADLESKGLRELFGILPEPLMSLAARASQTLEWSFAHAFCGRCGSPTDYSPTELARTCPSCGAIFYPRLTPAVITLVRRGSDILLARGRRFGSNFYSLIAGFVEPGETLEQAVAREVLEEVGIEIEDIRYFGSQSWPFPSQMMVGFTAHHASGSIQINESELSDARWFPIDELPGDVEIPNTFSISGRLIRSALPSERGTAG